jgi:RHS repeat-associated protein
MKRTHQPPSWKILPFAGLAVLLLHFVLPSPRAQYATRCARAYVCIAGREWANPPLAGQDTNPIPWIAVNSCQETFAFATAYSDSGATPPGFNATNNNTGAKITTVSYGTNWIAYSIENPTKIGNILVEAWGTDAHGVTMGATGTLEVVSASCGTCGCLASDENIFGNGAACLASLDFRLNLGVASPLESAGILWLKADVPSTNLARPAALEIPFARTNVEVIRNQGVIRQIRAPQGLVNISTNGNFEYAIECFYDKDVTDKSGLYYGTSATAFVTWTIQNPDAASSSNRLCVIERRGATSLTNLYSYSADYRWDLTRPDGQTNSVWQVAADAGNSNLTNYYRQVRVGNQVISQEEKLYEYVPGTSDNLLRREIFGTGGLTQTNTYTYYTNTAASNLLQRAEYWDGRWVHYVYDDQLRKAKEYSAFGTNAPPACPTNEPLATSTCFRLTEYSYGLTNRPTQTLDPTNLDTLFVVVTTKVKLPTPSGSGWDMHEVSRTYDLYAPGYHETRRCLNPEAELDDTSNLRTLTTTYPSDDFRGGLPETIKTYDPVTAPSDPWVADQTFYYSDAFTTTEIDLDGSSTTTIVDDWGKTQSREKYWGGVLASQELFNYLDGDEYLDQLRRSYDVTDLAGRTTKYRYACCGLESIEDPDGTITSFDYDPLHRQVASTRFFGGTYGIKTTNTLDALGRILCTRRMDTNGNAIVQAQTLYDVLGRAVRQTNALGGITITTNRIINNRLWVTNTYPDGGTRIEAYYRDGRLERVLGTAAAPLRYVYGADQDDNTWREFTLEIKLDASGGTNEWTKTYVDGAGRAYKTVYPGPGGSQASAYSSFNYRNQLWKQIDPDGLITLHAYYEDTYPKQEYTIQAFSDTAKQLTDYDSLYWGLYSGLLDSGPDRITRIQRGPVAADGNPDRINVETYAWDDDGEQRLLSRSETSCDGLWTAQTTVGDNDSEITNILTNVYATGGSRYSTNTAPDGSKTINVYSYGRLVSTTRTNSDAGQLQQTTFAYDAHGRQSAFTDALNGTTTFAFNDADLVTTNTTPAPATGQSAQTTTTAYDTSLRAWKITQPDGTSLTNKFAPTGLLTNTCGSRTYPVGYTYDAQGRVKTMITWTNLASGNPATTTWHYDLYRGWLTNKLYANGKGTLYSNSPAGRLARRIWARGTNTVYSYNDAGDLDKIDYSDATPDVTFAYDRRGRQTGVTNGAFTCLKTYNNAGQLTGESWLDGPLDGLSVTNIFDDLLRRTNVTLLESANTLAGTGYAYDSASRFRTVTALDSGLAELGCAAYVYLANSPLVGQIHFTNSGACRMTTTKQYDKLNRLLSVSSAPSAALPVNFSYTYNDANQRTARTETGGSYWVYGYDALGQVTSGEKYWADGTPVAGQQFEYSFDQIGNRRSTKAGGDQSGSGLRPAAYAVDNLNRYTSRSVTGAVDVIGATFATNAVTVNGAPAYRKGEYFWSPVLTNNSTGPVWLNIEVRTNGQLGVSGHQFIPQTPEQFGYDLDGNLTNDGHWAYFWDAENRLVAMAARTAVGPQISLKFDYDAQGRRVRKQVWDNKTWDGDLTSDLRFIYDGWNLLATLNSQLSPLNTFVWGADLSGSLQGAGGVGGLLMLWDSSTLNSQPSTHFAACDGNGNVAALVKGSDGTLSARYEFGPFGEVIRATGPMAKANPFRFSTKYQDDETDLLYYGYRYYDPSTGRWDSRDPAGARSGPHAYGFVNNEPLNNRDYLGLQTLPDHPVLDFHASPIHNVSNCGFFTYSILWFLSTRHPAADAVAGGMVVQLVSVSIDARNCQGSKLTLGPPSTLPDPQRWPIYEGWTIAPGGRSPGRSEGQQHDDRWIMPSFGLHSRGSITITGKADYFDGETLPWYFQPDPASPSGGLPTSTFFIPPGEPTSSVIRVLKAEWDCCCKERDTVVTVTTK